MSTRFHRLARHEVGYIQLSTEIITTFVNFFSFILPEQLGSLVNIVLRIRGFPNPMIGELFFSPMVITTVLAEMIVYLIIITRMARKYRTQYNNYNQRYRRSQSLY